MSEMETIEEFLRKYVQQFESLSYIYFEPDPIEINAIDQLEIAKVAREERQYLK